MKKQSNRKANSRNHDRQVNEFEKADLGGDIRSAGAATIIRPKAKPTSILLEPDLITELKKKGAKRGLGYQTMLKLIVREHLEEY